MLSMQVVSSVACNDAGSKGRRWRWAPCRTAPCTSAGGPVASRVDGAFHDPDGDALIYSATSSAPAIVAARTEGAGVTLTPNAAGVATISVTASDRDGSNGSATLMFSATVTVRVAVQFTDPDIRPGTVPVRAAHFRELRERIDGARAGAGLAGFGWTDAVLTSR